MEGKIFMPPPPKELKKTKQEKPVEQPVQEEPLPKVVEEDVAAEKPEKKHLNINWGLVINICGFLASVCVAAVCIYLLVK